MRKLPILICLILASTVLGVLGSAPATAATTGNSHPQPGQIVSDDPANFTPHILNGTVNSIVQVGNMVVVGGTFTPGAPDHQQPDPDPQPGLRLQRDDRGDQQRRSTPTRTTPSTRCRRLRTARRSTSAAGSARRTASPCRAGCSRPTWPPATRDTDFQPAQFTGDIRDLEVIGNRLWVAGKFTHIGGVAQKALGTINATAGSYDSYFTGVVAGMHRDIATTPPTAPTSCRSRATRPTPSWSPSATSPASTGASRSQIAQVRHLRARPMRWRAGTPTLFTVIVLAQLRDLS